MVEPLTWGQEMEGVMEQEAAGNRGQTEDSYLDSAVSSVTVVPGSKTTGQQTDEKLLYYSGGSGRVMG